MAMTCLSRSRRGSVRTASCSLAAVAWPLCCPRRPPPRRPTPLTADVEIAQVEKRVVAVKAFPGIVTDEEVEQRQVLMQVLESQSEIGGVDATQVSTCRHNSPLTLPWRRRNEIAIVVTTGAGRGAHRAARRRGRQRSRLWRTRWPSAGKPFGFRFERRRELLEANAAVPEPTPEPGASADAALEGARRGDCRGGGR